MLYIVGYQQMLEELSSNFKPLASERRHLAVSRTTLVLAIFGHFLLFLEEKTKSIRFGTKFYLKAATFLQSKYTSLLLRRNQYSEIGGIFKNLLEHNTAKTFD